MNSVLLSPPTNPPQASVAVPGSKSDTNRALVIAALTRGVSTLEDCSASEDSEALVRGLRALGVGFKASGSGFEVSGLPSWHPPPTATIDVGPAGTTMRFLTAVCSLIPEGNIVLRGTPHMHTRPIGPLVDALSQLGASIAYEGRPGCPPLRIRGTAIAGGEVTMEGSESSQYFSSLLMIAPLLSNGLHIRVRGEQVSRPYIEMTIATMRAFGAVAYNHHFRSYEVPPESRYQSACYAIDGDASGATYFWGVAAVTGGSVTTTGLKLDSCQGDLAFLDILAKMGCRIEKGSEHGGWIRVEGPARLSPVSANLRDMPDTAPTLAVIAACAEGESLLTGLETLRRKETDRISALQTELAKTNIATDAEEAVLLVRGGSPQPAAIETYDDHRIAMAFAMLGARTSGMRIINPHVVRKSMPTFWQHLSQLGVQIDEGHE